MNENVMDKYGAIVLIKSLIESTLKEVGKIPSMDGSLSIVVDCLKTDLIELQTEVEKDFLGKLKDLSDTEKRNKKNEVKND